MGMVPPRRRLAALLLLSTLGWLLPSAHGQVVRPAGPKAPVAARRAPAPAPAPVRDPHHPQVQALVLPEERPAAFAVDVLHDGRPRTLLLQRHDLRGPDFAVHAWSPAGTQAVAPPPVGTSRGEVVGEPGSLVVAHLGRAGLAAQVVPALGEAWELRPLAAGDPSLPRVLHETAEVGHAHAPVACPVGDPSHAELTLGGGNPPAYGPTVGGARGSAQKKGPGGPPKTCLYLCEVAFDCDFEYYQAKGSSIAAVVDSVEAHMNIVDAFYARDTQISYELPLIVVRTAPFYAPTGGGDLLNLFGAEWNANQPVERDIAHLLTGKPGSLIEFGGLAWVGVMCHGSIGYGWSMDNTNALGHEIGHNWGSGHCHDLSPCNTMCGGCFYVGPNSKDIMTATRDNAPCLTRVPFYETPLPPYAHPDRLELRKSELDGLAPVAFDVLGNDHDGNCDAISLASYDAVGTSGGNLDLSAGTGPDGRDELVYSAPADLFVGDDTFEYVVQDVFGRSAIGELRVRSRPELLAGSWPLDDGAGTTAADATSAQHDGTTSGGPLWVSGQVAGGLDFDGIDDAVTLPTLDLATDEFTITTWMKREGAQLPFAGVVFSRAGSTTAGLNMGGFSELRYHWNDAASSYNWNSGLVPPNNTWVFVALVVEPTGATMYMHDGVLQSATNPVPHGEEAFDGATTLGMDPGSTSRDFAGVLDEVRIYDHALDQAQILDVFEHGGRAESPSPADGGNLPDAAWGLDWLAGTFADSHDVYLGTSYVAVRDATTSDPEFMGNQLATGYVPAGLVPETTYYWRVDERAGGSVLPGEVWQFQLAESHRWTLDELSGATAFDETGTHPGTYFGNPLKGQPGAAPSLGTSVNFDGLNDRVRIPPLDLDTDTLTITCWIRREGDQTSWSALVFCRAQTTAAGLNFGFGQELRYHWDGGQWPWDSQLVVPDATWTFVALVVEPDQATIAMSQGGQLVTAVNSASHAPEAFDASTEIGRDQGFSNRWFDGQIDDVRIYDAALSIDQLQQIFDGSL